jgi:hypothetical protein
VNKANRAAQFNSFDALKGLKEALKEKEEKHSRVERRELSEEQQDELSYALSKTSKGSTIRITFYRCGHYASIEGIVDTIDVNFKYLIVGKEKIFFDDICEVKMI